MPYPSPNQGGSAPTPPLPEGYEWRKGSTGGELELWKDGKHLTNVRNELFSLLADEGKNGAIDVAIDESGSHARVVWIKPDGGEVHLVFANDTLNVFRSWESKDPSPLLTQDDAIAVWSGLNSMAATAKNDNPSLISFDIPPSVGYEDWEYSMVPLSITQMEGGEVRGTAFRVRDGGVIECRKDMYAVAVELILVGNWDASRNVVIGVGVGDPNAIIGTVTTPGEPGSTYISRFISAGAGRGNNRDVTLSISAQPVGRGGAEPSNFGILAGDRIFPVIYAEETTLTGIQIKDLIFVVREVSI